MAINPSLVSLNFPYLPLTLSVLGQTETIEALIDTGFDGDVVVPPGPLTAGQSPDGHLHWSLADGSQVRTPAYLGTLRIDNFPPIDVVIIVLGNEPIVGQSVIITFRLTLDHGLRVIVDR